MEISVLQDKIDNLLNSVHQLLPVGSNIGYVYADDLSALNYSIHTQIDELYSQRGSTIEQEAALCSAILTGYSVSMYSNAEDESKKQRTLVRSQELLQILSPSSLKEQLLAICNELTETTE